MTFYFSEFDSLKTKKWRMSFLILFLKYITINFYILTLSIKLIISFITLTNTNK
jgi:hypothetical protein